MNLFRNWAASDFQQQAAEFCALARASYGLELDYTAATLTDLDHLIETHFGPRSADDNPAVIVMMGCYVGEVLIRRHGGVWCGAEEFFRSPAVVMEGKLQTRTFPLSRVWKRFEYGPEHSLEAYYREVGGLLARL
ncbi:MAG: hypothetical protein ACE5H2_00005 [Terriglobia bacterium]